MALQNIETSGTPDTLPAGLDKANANFVELYDRALSPWAIKTTTYTAVAGDRIIADVTDAAFTVTLPASPTVGDEVEIMDGFFTTGFAGNNLTVGRNGQSIAGAAEDLVCDSNKALVRLIFVGGSPGWRVVITP